nr:MAG TPA: hypothetical protein [Bacteriophage sp.]
MTTNSDNLGTNSYTFGQFLCFNRHLSVTHIYIPDLVDSKTDNHIYVRNAWNGKNMDMS